MVRNVRSAGIAGVIALVAYTVISMLTGTSFGTAFAVGLVYMAVTIVVAFVILMVIEAIRRNKAID